MTPVIAARLGGTIRFTVGQTGTYRRQPEVVFRWFREAVLVGGPEGLQRLEGAAAAAWSVLDTPATQLEAEARVLERALADSGECSVDLGGALAMLAEAGLVGVDGAGDGDVSTDR